MNESYFLITCSEDGDIRVDKYSRAELLTTLSQDDHGKLDFLNQLVANDPELWGNRKCILIKGEIVVPYPKETAVTYDVK